MELMWPGSLSLLVAVAALAAVYVILQRRRRRYALRYASIALVRQAVGPGPGIRRHVPPALFLIGLVLLVFALARPTSLVRVPGLEGTVILAIDTSGSMLASDVKPDRLSAAKQAAKAFVIRQRLARNNVRVGVVSFSDNAELVMAPTLDRDGLLDAIGRLRTKRATAIGQAIKASLQAIHDDLDQRPVDPDQQVDAPAPTRTAERTARPVAPGEFASAAIVLLTDGENNQSPPPLSVLDDAVRLGIRVYTVGIGTPEGAVVTNEGRSARSELDEATLIKIAEGTRAKYFNAQTEADLSNIYDDLATELVLRDERTEVTVLFASLAGAALVLAASFSLLWFSRLP